MLRSQSIVADISKIIILYKMKRIPAKEAMKQIEAAMSLNV